MNAAAALVASLDRAALVRLAAAALDRAATDDSAALVARLARRFAGDLVALLNALDREALEAACAARELAADGDLGALRARLWHHGAALEAGGAEHLGRPYQPVPVVLRGRLRRQGPTRGASPPSERWPRPVPPSAAWPAPPEDEPDTLEDLLARATALLGVRLGPAGRDKGAFGGAVAALLGVRERGDAEADWRGEVEIKTVPVVRDRSGAWRVKEDPAIAMEDVDPWRKLARVLWVARVADAGDSPILSWYFQERDEVVDRLVIRYLHTRPKGGAGATTRGHYLHKSFFLESGFLASLNG
jgi:hypothetical protein